MLMGGSTVPEGSGQTIPEVVKTEYCLESSAEQALKDGRLYSASSCIGDRSDGQRLALAAAGLSHTIRREAAVSKKAIDRAGALDSFSIRRGQVGW